jgi:hypothetical protein
VKESLNQHRQAENEVIFRQANEKVNNDFDAIRKSAHLEGDMDLVHDTDMSLFFYCECSDENCKQRINLKQSQYKKLHKSSSQFIVLPGHNDPTIERTLKKTKNYLVVEKYITPPQKVSQLKKTEKKPTKKP